MVLLAFMKTLPPEYLAGRLEKQIIKMTQLLSQYYICIAVSNARAKIVVDHLRFN